MRIGIIDYGMGNLRSVEWALQYLEIATQWVRHGRELTAVDALVLPGVGAFPKGMEELVARELEAPLRAWLDADRPFLGICLGYQMLFDGSSEGGRFCPGFGVFPGRVDRFDDAGGVKVPQIGWNDATLPDGASSSPLREFAGDYFYFVHGYAPFAPVPTASLRTTYGGQSFTSAAVAGRVWGAQFHPERSGDDGLKFLRAFLRSATA